MNLLCPNCQKMLTVPEQYAGQLMKCPLCAGTFTVPALPDAGTSAPATAPSPFPGPAGPEEVYSIRDDVHSAPPSVAPTLPIHTEPTSTPPAPPPDLAHSTTPAPPAPMPLAPMPPAPSPAPEPTYPEPPSSGSKSLMDEDFRRVHVLRFNPLILRWVAPVCVLLIFILSFFPWVGIYPGGVPAVTQSAWGAAFGSWEPDPDLAKTSPLLNRSDKEKPNANVLLIFYILLFLVDLVVTLGFFVMELLALKSPPGLQSVLPWRWGIIAAINLLALFFLVLQLIIGFTIESTTKDIIDNEYKTAPQQTTPEQKVTAIRRGGALDALHRTAWLDLAVAFQLLATVGAAMVFWIERRGTHRPLPRLELKW